MLKFKPMRGKAYIDGGARGNPGPAGAGVVVKGPQPLFLKKFLGNTTNNVAEYSALLLLLNKAKQYNELDIYADSELLVKQLKGEYKVKDPKLKELYLEAQKHLQKLKKYTINHIPRENNKEADRLVNEAIDGGLYGNN